MANCKLLVSDWLKYLEVFWNPVICWHNFLTSTVFLSCREMSQVVCAEQNDLFSKYNFNPKCCSGSSSSSSRQCPVDDLSAPDHRSWISLLMKNNILHVVIQEIKGLRMDNKKYFIGHVVAGFITSNYLCLFLQTRMTVYSGVGLGNFTISTVQR